MDNVNNATNINTQETEINIVEDNWILLSCNNKPKDNGDIIESSVLQKDSDNEVEAIQIKNNDVEVPCINADDMTNDVSTRSSDMPKDLSIKDWIKQSFSRNIVLLSKDEEPNKPNDTSDQSVEIQENLDNGIQIKSVEDQDIKAPCTIVESDDVSDDVSVITESDNANAVDTNSRKIYQLNMTYETLKMLGEQTNKQVHISQIFIACLLGIAIGFILGQGFCWSSSPEIYPDSDRTNAESFKNEIHNIVNVCKNLKEVNAILGKINTNVPIKEEMYIIHKEQLFKSINHTNNKNNKPFLEPFNSNLHLLEQFQISVNVLSSFLEIHDNNSSLRNEMDKALDIVNDTRSFYETLVLFNNSTQKMGNLVISFFENSACKIGYTSQSLLSDVTEKIRQIALRIYNKYNKIRRNLNTGLCRLRNILPNDNEFVKYMIERNQFLNQSCSSNDTSKRFNDKTSTKEDINAETSFSKRRYQAKTKRPKQKDRFKLNNPTENINKDDTYVVQENLFPQQKMGNRVLKSNDNYCDSKLSSCNSYTIKPENQQIKNADWQFLRSRAREQLRRPVESFGYSSRDQPSKSESKIESEKARPKMKKILYMLESALTADGNLDNDILSIIKMTRDLYFLMEKDFYKTMHFLEQKVRKVYNP